MVVRSEYQEGSVDPLKNPEIAAVDLFCGAGGLTFGLERAGIDVRLGVDADPSCQFPIEENTNALFLEHDITTLESDVLIEAWGNTGVRLLAGCAPCQPFSKYTQGCSYEDDPRWVLLNSFAKLIKETTPELVTMENVGELARHRVFEQLLASLRTNGYEYTWDIVDCRHYGIPQSRRRLVLIASTLGSPFLPTPSTPDETQWPTVKQAIEGLPPISAGEAHCLDPLHVSSELSDLNMARIRVSKPGGTWRDWPPDLITACHKRKTGKTYPAVYGRMEWEKPAPTITGQCYGYGNGRFGHPSEDRAISLREAAILQSFPGDYAFVPNDGRVFMRSIGLLIGNAVPPNLAQAIGTAMLEHVAKSSSFSRR